MNNIESFVYNLVRKNPGVKQFVRNIYQTTFDMLPRKKEFTIHPYKYKENYFFGFHDISPVSIDDTMLLANHISFDLRMPASNEGLEVGYFDLCDGRIEEFHPLGITYAWNYHKGCRLQWLGNNNIIFNTGIGDKLVSKIINITTKQEQIINFPIDAVHTESMKATSFSYERLERCMPGYGYSYNDEGYIEQDIPDKTGLFIVDLKTNTKQLIISINKLAETVSEEYKTDFLHYVTHSEFSPDGRYVSFLHRWIDKGGDVMKRWTRIVIYDFQTNHLIILPSQMSGSHYVWNTSNQIIASCIINGKSCHVLFDMNDINNYQTVSANILNSDGHQSFITNTTFVTDTYPNRYRMANLLKVDIQTGQVDLLASLYSPKKYQTKDFKCHIACDLHPRVSYSGKYLCWDSPRTGKRAIYLMKL